MVRAGGSWRDVREIGSDLGIRFLMTACRLVGRSGARLCLRFIVLYYAIVATSARRALRDYWRRVAGHARLSQIYRHMLRFAECTLDRYLLISGQTRGLQVGVHGHEHLQRAQNQGRGVLLLGAHLGSFEAMRAASAIVHLPISIVADFRGSRRISGVLERLDPTLRSRVISVGDGLSTVLAIKERIGASETVALLADRTEPQGRALPAIFFGSAAPFPVGPYLVASTLGCPVLLAFGIYTPPNRYDIYCEPFAERISLPQRHRDPALRTLIQGYADRLEHYCRMAPDNWFNFFPFWPATPGR